ncbi:MAG TPA: zf-HC2 domain-containing protein [Methylomirabilota bacterium]|nr:zf-HC2 domain-containing protein [Methylomirabilota bacterium]
MTGPSPSIPHPVERLLPYWRGELAAAEAAAVAAHLESCADCRATLAAFTAIAGRLERAPDPTPPVHWGAFRAELREALEARTGRRRSARSWRLGALPAALAAGLAALVLYLAIPGQNGVPNGRGPAGENAAVDNAALASQLDLITDLDVVQRLDLLEDFDVIGRLDRLEPTGKS